jgi:hypothetical protein
MTVDICYRSGARQKLICAGPKQARDLWRQILDSLEGGLAYVVMEDAAEPIILASAEIASISTGVSLEMLRV